MIKNSIIFLSTCTTLFYICTCGLAQSKSSLTKLDISQTTSKATIQKIKQNSNQANYKPKDGYVPDKHTAIAIAVAVWIPIYGKAKIKSEKPYKAQLKNDVWTVTGSLPKGYKGGVAEADIAKDDGRILRVIHGK